MKLPPQVQQARTSSGHQRTSSSGRSPGGRLSGSLRRNARQGSETYSAAEHAKATNKNLVNAYAWTSELLESIVANKPPQVTDLATGRTGSPIFAVYGACPNSLCGMQAVMYVKMEGAKGPQMDFWWIKPKPGRRDVLESATLNRNAKGPNKNDPGRSRPLYAGFATLFESASASNNKVRGDRPRLLHF